MSAAALHMPLRTSPDAPHFCGNANSLSHYLAEVEDLCQSRQRTTGPELIKYAVYYTDEKSWNIWDSAREVLTDPASWEDFKNAMHDLYPSYEVIHAHAPLLASLPPSSVPSAPLLGPLLPAAAVLLASDALQALLASHPRPVLPAGTVELQSPASSVLASQPPPMPPASDVLLLPASLVLPATSVPAVLPPLPMPVPCAQSLPNAADLLPVPMPH